MRSKYSKYLPALGFSGAVGAHLVPRRAIVQFVGSTGSSSPGVVRAAYPERGFRWMRAVQFGLHVMPDMTLRAGGREGGGLYLSKYHVVRRFELPAGSREVPEGYFADMLSAYGPVVFDTPTRDGDDPRSRRRSFESGVIAMLEQAMGVYGAASRLAPPTFEVAHLPGQHVTLRPEIFPAFDRAVVVDRIRNGEWTIPVLADRMSAQQLDQVVSVDSEGVCLAKGGFIPPPRAELGTLFQSRFGVGIIPPVVPVVREGMTLAPGTALYGPTPRNCLETPEAWVGRLVEGDLAASVDTALLIRLWALMTLERRESGEIRYPFDWVLPAKADDIRMAGGTTIQYIAIGSDAEARTRLSYYSPGVDRHWLRTPSVMFDLWHCSHRDRNARLMERRDRERREEVTS